MSAETISDAAPQAFYVPDTFARRAWRWLGFRYPSLYEQQEAALALDYEPCKWMATDTFIRFDWKDRLRILLSGNVKVIHRHRTDVTVKQCASMSAVGVLPPGAR